jgi:dCTP deaminase
MILSNKDILACLGDTVIIEPFNPANVNTSSYDVTLGEYYFIEHRPWFRSRDYNIWDFKDVKRVWGEPQLAQEVSYFRYSKFRPEDRVIWLPPKTTILAHTKEFIGGRINITTMMKARSSFGRNFIEVCKCAGYGDVGYFNRWTMEITNNSRFYSIPLVVGRRIAQIVFMQTGELSRRQDEYAATGKYQLHSDVRDLMTEWRPEMMLPRLDRDREVLNLCLHGHADWDDCPVCGH